jgi:hypothetical protein
MNSNVECLTSAEYRSIGQARPVCPPIRNMISNEIATQETNRFNQRPAEIFERTTDIFSIRRHVSKVPGADSGTAVDVDKLDALFDHLVGAREQHRRHGEAERLGDFEVDNQLIFVGACTGRSAGFSRLRRRST